MRLLHRRHDPDRASLDQAQRTDLGGAEGQYCRCTGYRSIEDALLGKTNVEESVEPGAAFGRSLPAPAGPDVVRGKARYTFDTQIDGLLHIKLLRSPHAHAKIVAIDKSDALRVPGVHAVLTHEDAPSVLISTARHEKDWRIRRIPASSMTSSASSARRSPPSSPRARPPPRRRAGG